MLFCFTMFGREYFGELEPRGIWGIEIDRPGNVWLWLGRVHIISSPVTLRKRFDELYDPEGRRLDLH
jgi:hypothetical protein